MPRELLLMSERSVDLVDVLDAAMSVDADHAVHSIWDGGAMQVVASDSSALLTVMTSALVESSADAVLYRGAPWPPGGRYLTEAYIPFGSEEGKSVVRALVASMSAHLITEEAPR